MYFLFITIILFLLPMLLILPENKGFVNNIRYAVAYAVAYIFIGDFFIFKTKFYNKY